MPASTSFCFSHYFGGLQQRANTFTCPGALLQDELVLMQAGPPLAQALRAATSSDGS